MGKTPDLELAERVRQAVQERDAVLSVGDALGIDRSNVSRMLTGKRSISASELVTISDVLGVPLLDLLGRTKPRLMKLAARIASDPVDGLAGERRRVARLFEQRDVLSRFMQAPVPQRVPVSVPTTSFAIERGKTLANNVRHALSLGDDPIEDLAELVQQRFDIDVAFEPLRKDLAGLLIREGAGSDPKGQEAVMILVNSQEFFGRQRLTCAHELAHYLFGDGAEEIIYADYKGKSSSRLETAANSFAINFLLPETAARRHAETFKSDGSRNDWCKSLVGYLAGQYGVSTEAVAYHLANLSVITEEERETIRELHPKRPIYEAGNTSEWFDHVEENHRGVTVPPTRISDMALSAYQAGLIGIGTIAELFAATDERALAQDLAEAGWAPAFL